MRCSPIFLPAASLLVAGVLASGALFQLTGEEIARAVATNLTAPIDLTRLALPDLALVGGERCVVGNGM